MLKAQERLVFTMDEERFTKSQCNLYLWDDFFRNIYEWIFSDNRRYNVSQETRDFVNQMRIDMVKGVTK